MNPQLAGLLSAYDAFREAAPDEADRLGDAYEAQLRNCSEQSGIPVEQLDRAVKMRYLRQVRAEEKRPSTLPPRA